MIYTAFKDYTFDAYKLCVFYLGGKVDSCNIEMHDVVFLVGNSSKNMAQLLKKKWVGTPHSLHIDSWFVVDSVDGFNIKIENIKPSNTDHHLFFVNIGSYKKSYFGEKHFMSLVVSESKSKAIKKALSSVNKDEDMLHCDNIYDIDQCIRIDTIDNYYINLEYTGLIQENIIINGYQKII